MKTSRRFPERVVEAARTGMVVGIKAGKSPHRIIALWAVVVENRVFIRSWSLKPRSWYRTFVKEPVGVLQVGSRKFHVRAVRTRSERLKKAVDRAYLSKYHTPGSLRFARDLAGKKSRATTTELIPL